jgi:predicted PurR-regulated permease PerM
MFGLPVLLILLYFTASLFISAIITIATAGIIALLLDPLVRQLERVHIPRHAGVFLIYLTFLGLVILFFFLVITLVIDQLTNLLDELPERLEGIREQFESWRLGEEFDRLVDRVDDAATNLAAQIVDYSINAVNLIVQIFLIVFLSIYMLLDARRIGRFVRSLFPQSKQNEADEFVIRTKSAVSRWMMAQTLLSLLVGISTGLGVWILGLTGVWPEGTQFAIFFGAWAGLTNVIPFMGPILGALPPMVLAAFASPLALIAVAIVIIVIQQLEGNVLVPNIMAHILGTHPLIVIFAVLAGAEVRGIAGVLLTLPLLALGTEVVAFFKPYISLEKSGGKISS